MPAHVLNFVSIPDVHPAPEPKAAADPLRTQAERRRATNSPPPLTNDRASPLPLASSRCTLGHLRGGVGRLTFAGRLRKWER